jgi:hypothetical protein
LVDPIRHRLHLLCVSGHQRRVLGIDLHMSESQN